MILWLLVVVVVVVVGGLLGALLYVKTHAGESETTDDSGAADGSDDSDDDTAEDGGRRLAGVATAVGEGLWHAAEKVTRPPEDDADEETDAGTDTTASPPTPPATDGSDGSDGSDDDSEPVITRAEVAAAVAQLRGLVASIVAATGELAAGSETKRARWRMAGAVVAVLGAVVGMAVAAASLTGTVAGIAFVGAAVLGATGPPVAILTLREGLPNIVGTGLAIAAQIAFGKAALVRRDDGRYEWTALRETDESYVAELDDGRTVPIDAEAGDLYAFGFGRLAITEQKTDRNLSRWRVAEGTPDGGTETRAGIEVAPPQRERGGILVSLATIQRAVRGSASSTLVRRGRDKALDEEGGEQGVSQLWTMAFATVLLIVGFGMTFLALSL